MNAVSLPLEVQLEPLTMAWVDAVAQMEQSAYSDPWTHGNFTDALQVGYHTQLLTAGTAGQLIGYFVALKGVDEVHLLKITVAWAHQRCGWARTMLDAVSLWARGQNARHLWLEVRPSNVRAHAMYWRYGFRQVGVRPNYYPPANPGELLREEAIVMSLLL